MKPRRHGQVVARCGDQGAWGLLASRHLHLEQDGLVRGPWSGTGKEVIEFANTLHLNLQLPVPTLWPAPTRQHLLCPASGRFDARLEAWRGPFRAVSHQMWCTSSPRVCKAAERNQAVLPHQFCWRPCCCRPEALALSCSASLRQWSRPSIVRSPRYHPGRDPGLL